MAEKLAPDKRHCLIHSGQKVFEWNQNLEEVNIYIDLPPNVPMMLFYCEIQSRHFEVGIRANPPYLHHDLAGPVKTDSSFRRWDGTMHLRLQKRDEGHTWSSPMLGQGLLDPYSANLEQKRLMLQRFQEEDELEAKLEELEGEELEELLQPPSAVSAALLPNRNRPKRETLHPASDVDELVALQAEMAL